MRPYSYVVAAVLVPVGLATPCFAGIKQDVQSCNAAKNLGSATACTRVMKSGRLPRNEFYIGYFNRGTAYRRAGDYRKALADFKRVVKLKPKFAKGYLGRGVVHADLGKGKQALADLDRAINLNTKDWSAYFSRATLLRGRKDYDGALLDLKKAHSLKPKQSEVLMLRALVMADKGAYSVARAEINKVISKGRAKAASYYARAAVAYKQLRLDAAMPDLDKALKLKSSFAAAHALKGRILEARGDTTGAKRHYRKALAAPVNFLDARSGHRTARERLKVLTGKDTPPSVALNQGSSKLDCKRFLPATGVTISAPCGD